MKAMCTIRSQGERGWIARHSGPELGCIQVTGSTRAEALAKLQRELQFRIEWCPCSGVSGDTVELEVRDADGRV